MKTSNLVTVEISHSKQTMLNLIATIVQFGLSLLISFFLSPFIVKNLGAEANGFVTLANNFTAYFSVIIIALNGMASRFIAVSYHRGEKEKANLYYSSLFWGDLILTIVFSAISIFFVFNLEKIVNVSPELVNDVKILFALIFANYLIGVLVTIWSSATYIANKVYLNSIANMLYTIIRLIIIVTAFTFFEPKIFYLGVATLVPAFILNLCNLYFKVKLIPDLSVKKDNFNLHAVKVLISSGCWNSVSRIGGLLETGCSMLITNLFISPSAMGVLSVARSMPSVIDGLNGNLSSAFLPSLIKDYALSDRQAMVNNIKSSSKIISVICAVPLCFLIVFGEPFYHLWQPTLPSSQVHILSLLICMAYVLVTGTQSLFNIFTAYNKVKQNSISVLIMGSTSIILTLILLRTTDLGIYAVAGVSPIVNIGRYMLFVIPFSAKYMGLKWTTFYPIVGHSAVSVVVLCIIGSCIKAIIPTGTWMGLILSAGIFAVAGFSAEIFLLLNKTERNSLKKIVKKKIKNN